MKNFRAYSLCLVASALTLSACAKDDLPGDSGPSTASTTNNNNTTNDDDTETSGSMTTFSSGDGDGDGDPGSTTITTMGFVPMTDIMMASQCDPWAQDCPDGEK
jgi:hypothetical protein